MALKNDRKTISQFSITPGLRLNWHFKSSVLKCHHGERLRTSGFATPWLTPFSPRWEGKGRFWNALTCYKCSSLTQTLEDKANWSFVERCTIICYLLSGWFNWITVSKLNSSLGKLNSSIYTRNKQNNKPENRKYQEVCSSSRGNRMSSSSHPGILFVS